MRYPKAEHTRNTRGQQDTTMKPIDALPHPLRYPSCKINTLVAALGAFRSKTYARCLCPKKSPSRWVRGARWCAIMYPKSVFQNQCSDSSDLRRFSLSNDCLETRCRPSEKIESSLVPYGQTHRGLAGMCRRA